MDINYLIDQIMDKLWNRRDLNVLSSHFSEHSLIRTPLLTGHGYKNLQQFVTHWHNAFPDSKHIWQDWIVEGNKYIVCWIATGTHLGELYDIKPTQRKISCRGTSIYRFNSNKVMEYWYQMDFKDLVKQLT